LDFEQFRVFLEKACGILLGENKQYLVSSRLNKLMEQQGIKSLGELVQRIQTQPRSGLREQVVDAMTTNETLWFRDTYPFEVLKNKVLPEAIKASPGQRLRIWSAACSSGQEPYSLSMSIDEFERSNLGQLKMGVQIVATDLSGTMLTNCKTGEYDSLAIGRGLSRAPAALLRPERAGALGDQGADQEPGGVPLVQPARQLRQPGQVRHRVLPQRADLLLGRGEEGHPVAHSQHAEAGWLSVPWCVRSAQRFAGSLPDGPVQSGDHLPGEVIRCWTKRETSEGSRFFMPGVFLPIRARSKRCVCQWASGRKAAGGGNRLPLFWHCRRPFPAKPRFTGLQTLAWRLLKFMYEKQVTRRFPDMSISFDKALGIHEKALGFRAQRAEVLANNIANADTPNYKARDLDFSKVLAAQSDKPRTAPSP
jgi:hypothetical protein